MPGRNYPYARLENDGNENGSWKAKMGAKLDKFILLMWKNWLLQFRHPKRVLLEILAPVLVSVAMVGIRTLSTPSKHDVTTFEPFCTIPITNNFTNVLCNRGDATIEDYFQRSGATNIPVNFSEYSMVFSPRSPILNETMDVFRFIFGSVIELEDSAALNEYFLQNPSNTTFLGIQFDDSYKDLTDLSKIDDYKVSIRFPAETRWTLDPLGANNWKTNLIYPLYQSPGPRQYGLNDGGAPSYSREGYLAVQQILTVALIVKRKNIGTTEEEILAELKVNPLPLISVRRYPYPEWYEDQLINSLTLILSLLMMLGFTYSCTNMVKSITTEKEKQLKESMKIMGLPNWLHWTAWFLRCFIFLFISAIIIVVVLKVKWSPSMEFTIFTNADPFVMFLFLILYMCSIITFSFAISVFFSKASVAAIVASVIWFLSYAPYMFMQQHYATLDLASKLLASLGINSAMGYGFQVILMYEGTTEGVQWNNLFTPNSPDDNLSLGLIMIMLIVDTFLYLFIALYVEAIFPGDYGVPQPWYYPFTTKYWCGSSKVEDVGFSDTDTKTTEFFETEPTNLATGVAIRNMRKVFNGKPAVRNLSLNMYDDQITVLLGHNGAGKTTTMSMLTGMITPTSGTATVNGYDIRTEIDDVRSSLGLCPQHNIIFDDLTVAEHLYFFSRLKGLQKNEIAAEIDKYVQLLELEDKRNSKASTLSGGMKRKLCVGMALCGKSKVVMLDEPTAGMDPSARRALWGLLQSQKEGRTMLLTTHFMDEADLLGDRIAIMAGGELQCCGSSFFLKKKYGVGYSLILDKSSDCRTSQVTQTLQKHIPDIEVQSNIGSELTYLLAENQSPRFEPMLRELEDNSERLGVHSYGIALTTLEEVFMKVGADHGMEDEEGNDEKHGIIHTNGHMTNGHTTLDIGIEVSYFGGLNLLMNQFLAMLMKRILSTYRSWMSFLLQLILPVIFVIMSIMITRSTQGTGSLPALVMDLNRFDRPVTLVGNESALPYAERYLSVLRDLNYLTTRTTNVSQTILGITAETPTVSRLRYIVGASFDNIELIGDITVPHITTWFNNDPYHSAGITLSLAMNAMLREMLDCDKCSITFTNHPLPYTAESQIEQLQTTQNMGFQLAYNVGFSMAIVASFYVLFIIRERSSNSKHLQFVSGVKVLMFWLTSALWDMATYIVTVLVFLVALVAFQEDGFKTADQIGRIFVIFLYFGWGFIPMIYIAGYFFSVPANGFTKLALIAIFTGLIPFTAVQVLAIPALDLMDVSRALHWLFLIVPHYSLSSGLNDYYQFFTFKRVCEQCINNICDPSSPFYNSTCKGVEESYFRWEAPGIGRNLLFSLIAGVVLFLILLSIEFKVFARVTYYISQKYFPKLPVDITDEDSDVAEERQKIKNATQHELLNNYALVLRDLTKYYKKFLAVNALCLGVQERDCFGLLGVNGAGKTSTFKMITGDVSISYGDGWVKGFSIKNQIKKVQKCIGYCPQFDALLDDLTVRETITMFALLRGIRYSDCRPLAETLAREFDFQRHINKKVKELSGGNKRKLSTSIALIGDPPVIYLDEPTTGMDPATKRNVWNALCKVREAGKCIILTSHSMEECEALCTRLAIMVNGQFKCLGSTQHLKSKFAEGYTFIIKVKKPDGSVPDQDHDTSALENYVTEHFPGAVLKEKHQDLLNYNVPSKDVKVSQMFGVLEGAKRANLNIEDYSLGQSSLEQVFLTFTRHQQ